MTEQNDVSLGGDPTSMTAQLSTLNAQSSMGCWSDDKRKDFVKTFHDRAKAAQFILRATAAAIQATALRSHFISPKHARGEARAYADRQDRHHDGCWRVGGRPEAELTAIATERAKEILSELPQAKKAVQIIKPDVAKLMDERDKLLVRGQKLVDEITELRRDVSMADVDQKMTVGEFRKQAKSRFARRREILTELQDIGKEGTALETKIARELYAGLPGLSEAVVKVIKQHNERADAMDQVQRRVEERVLFGDSAEAMAILSSFEKDEVAVSEQVRVEFGAALATLRLAGKKARAKK